jgi:hypothetical protein
MSALWLGYTDSALHPIISQMERAARFAHDDTPQVNDKLDAVLALASTSKQDAALFAEMLSTTDVIRRSNWTRIAPARNQFAF